MTYNPDDELSWFDSFVVSLAFGFSCWFDKRVRDEAFDDLYVRACLRRLGFFHRLLIVLNPSFLFRKRLWTRCVR